jgi:hypothetical protein
MNLFKQHDPIAFGNWYRDVVKPTASSASVGENTKNDVATQEIKEVHLCFEVQNKEGQKQIVQSSDMVKNAALRTQGLKAMMNDPSLPLNQVVNGLAGQVKTCNALVP